MFKLKKLNHFSDILV